MDCDAFFVQVARLEDPEGAGRTELLLVGGRSGRGVVTSASYGARAFGVRSGMPMSEALRRCPQATAVPVPRGACTARSRDVRAALESLAPIVEAASIDEFYLDLTGTERLFGGEPLVRTAERIRDEVLERTRIAVSIGGGTNRLVAKLAAGRAKPHARPGEAPPPHPLPAPGSGVYVVPPGAEARFLEGFTVRSLPGVGPRLAEALEEKGVRSVPELLAVEPAWLARWIGESRAAWLRARALGRASDRVSPGEPRKSISSERTFAADVPPGPEGDDILERRLLELCLAVGATLREKGFQARTVTVKLRDGDFTTRQRSRTLAGAIESDRGLYEAAREMLAELRARGRPTRLLGVGVAGFDDDPGQLDLLAEDPDAPPQAAESERDRTLSRLRDRVRDRYGDDALRPGRTLEGRTLEGRTLEGRRGGSSGAAGDDESDHGDESDRNDHGDRDDED